MADTPPTSDADPTPLPKPEGGPKTAEAKANEGSASETKPPTVSRAITKLPEHVWVVDGIEDAPHGRVARLEKPDGQTVDVPLRDLPRGVREGSALAVSEGPEGLEMRQAPSETRARTQNAQAHLEALNAETPAQPGEEIDL